MLTIRRAVAAVFRDVLGVDPVKVSTLSATGVDSLSSIRIASQLRRLGYSAVNATDILEARKLKDLVYRLTASKAPSCERMPKASLLDDASTRKALETHPRLGLRFKEVDDVFSCTPTQTAMLSETAKDPQAYCNWIELRIDSQYTLQRVEEALHRLTATHDMLRAGFAALLDAHRPYTAIVWKPDRQSSFIRRVEQLDKGFTITCDEELLCPRPIQVKTGNNSTEVVLQMHHAVYDQWSVDVLKADLAILLESGELPARSSFGAVSAFHSQSGEPSSLDNAEDFWQSHLQDSVPTSLPQLNETREERRLQRFPWRPTDVSTHKLRTRARELGSSGHAVLQAAFAYLLSMYTGASAVMYGTVFSGRELPVSGIEQIFGPCLATLPSRINTSDVRTGHDLVRTIHDRSRAMLKHASTPLAQIKKIGRFALDAAMFDTLFVWQESLIVAPEHVAEVDSADYHEFNLVLEVDPGPENLSIRMTYQQTRVSPQVVDLLFHQLQAVVHELVDRPHTPVAELGASLPSNLLSIANPYPKKHQYADGLVAALEDVCRQSPMKPALVFGSSLAPEDTRIRSMSYQDLHDEAARLANLLIARGIEPNDLVCICMEKSFELYVAILAVLKAGAGYLPLLPDTPIDRIRSAIDQAQVKICLSDNTSAEKLRSETPAEVINVHDTEASQYPASPPKLTYCGLHAAYSIFTSGSTGTPKGLVVTQDNLLGNLAHLSTVYPVESGDRLLQACSQAFDVSVFEVFFAWLKGTPLCFARKADLFNDFEHGVRALQVTHLSLTPTVAALVDPVNVPHVKFLVTAGEAMTEPVHKRWAGKKLYQGYGPSETTNICTVNPLMSASDIISNIGPPFANTSAFVIRAEGKFEILPLGAVGELAFGGEQVFRGYIGRDELNAEKTVEHSEYGRMYRSGDIGRLLPSGNILISGRLDDQIKMRGNRVELGEINACLLQVDIVRDAATIVLGGDATYHTLVSFWVPKNAGVAFSGILPPTAAMRTNVSSLFSRLQSSLPSYMVPDAIIPVRELPRTAQGKLDKRQLEYLAVSSNDETKPYYLSSSGASSDEEEEWTSLEQQLLQIIAQTLHIPTLDIRRSTSFFALGLNSINGIALAKAIASRLDRRVPVSYVLRHANIARLARSLSTEVPPFADRPDQIVALLSDSILMEAKSQLDMDSREIATVLPCTPLQEAMLSAGASQDGSAYCNVTTFTIHGEVAALRRCFEQLVSRHTILRTLFVETSDPENPYVQVVLRDRTLPWLDPTGPHQESWTQQQISFQQPYKLAIRQQRDETILTLCMHHASVSYTHLTLPTKRIV